MFEFLTPGVGSAFSGVLDFAGGLMQNSANRAAAGRQMEFQAQQAELNRQFSAAAAQQQQTWSSAEAGYQREWAQQEALRNRSWQEMMSNTSYQRSRADMLAAGLNPILMFGRGGASTPSGGQGSGGIPSGAAAASPGTPGGASYRAENFLGKAASSAFSAAATVASTREMLAKAEQSGAMVPAIQAATELDKQRTAESSANTARSQAEAARILAETDHIPGLRTAQTAAANAAAAASSASAQLTREQTATVPLQRSEIIARTGQHSAVAEAERQKGFLDHARRLVETYRHARQTHGTGEGHLAETVETIGRILEGFMSTGGAPPFNSRR